MQSHTVRRRSDGTIDIDGYRQEALLLRRQVMTQFFRTAGRTLRPVILAIIAAYISMRLILPTPVTADVPAAIAARGEVLVTTVRAVGGQIYECKRDSAGRPTWQFREPIATLIVDGKTVGRHFAGPVWEMADGSAVTAKVSAQAPGASRDDIPLLRLDVVAREGSGLLSGVTTIQRLNTRGGRADATCESPGLMVSVPYTADYAFYKKTNADSQSH